jgi:hypothetical protein
MEEYSVIWKGGKDNSQGIGVYFFSVKLIILARRDKNRMS